MMIFAAMARPMITTTKLRVLIPAIFRAIFTIASPLFLLHILAGGMLQALSFRLVLLHGQLYRRQASSG